jgi:hypothetical protein
MFVQLPFWIFPLLFLGRREQCLRIVALQQQLAVYQRQLGGKRLQLADEDRQFWVMLSLLRGDETLAGASGLPRPGPHNRLWARNTGYRLTGRRSTP